ncbi:uncharacterized protein [Eurosta solidaginis]|uniref:uncharacterized protein isoform X1 n=1 Tax=Eurosta solidaginis TaxID=178769 RepID=UPI003530D0A9
MEFQVYTKSEEKHLCQLCAEMRENMIELLNEGCEEYINLFRRTLGYLNIEYIEDDVSSKWLCAVCLMDAESTYKFLSKVAEGQNKLRQQTPHHSRTFKHTVSVKSEDGQNFIIETDSLHNFESSAEVDVKPTYEQFAENDCPTSYFATNDCTDMKVITLDDPTTYSNQLNEETTAASYVQTPIDGLATLYSKSGHDTASSDEEAYTPRLVEKKIKNVQKGATDVKRANKKNFKQASCPCRFRCGSKITRQRQEELFQTYNNSNLAEKVSMISSMAKKHTFINKYDGELDAEISSTTTNSSTNSQASSDEEAYTPPRVKKKLKNVQKTNSRIDGANKKSFKQVSCHCRFQCSSKITPQRQEELFQTYNNSNLAEQVLMISSTAKKHTFKKRNIKYMPGCKHRNIDGSYKYHLTDNFGISHEICRNFLLKLFQIIPATFYNWLKVEDPFNYFKPGCGPRLKPSDEKVNFVRNFINSLPSYESRFGRSSTKKKYLKEGLNLKKVYDEYSCRWKIETSSRQPEEQKPVSRPFFSGILKNEFNLTFKHSSSGKCMTCNEFNLMLKKENLTENERNSIWEDQKLHNQLAQQIQKEFLEDIKKAKLEDKTVVIVFDLQKALETPSFSSNIAFDKRQLWTYNLCIVNEVDGHDKVYMYVWSENMASRGADEIASCIIKHFRMHLLGDMKHIILYSNSCGGLNRSLKITLLIKHFLANSDIDLIEQKFFLSGHNYNMCDKQFLIIERIAEMYQCIETPDKWIDIIRIAKQTHPQFTVTKMEICDFISAEELNKLIINVKKYLNNEKIRKIQNHRAHPMTIFAFDDFKVMKKIEINRNNVSDDALKLASTPLLFPLGRPISDAKFSDLMKLMEFIGPEHRQFYENLQKDANAKDYGLASGGSDDE